MRKIFILILILITIMTNAQHRLYDVLNNLDVSNKKIDYFPKKSVVFKEIEQLAVNDLFYFYNKKSKIEFNFLAINRVDNYHVFAILTKNELTHLRYNSINYYDNILLYDQANNKIFLIHYEYDGFPLIKINDNSFEITTNFTESISKWIHLNNDFSPVYSINFETFKGYYVYSVDLYFMISGISHLKTEKIVDNKLIKFEDLLYNDIQSILNDKIKKCTKSENTYLYTFD